MAHFAKLDENNSILDVVVVANQDVNNLEFPDSEPIGIAFLKNLFGEDTNWKQTSYNANFRGMYACIGGTYDAERDIFVSPQPFPSWTFNYNDLEWYPPSPYPGYCPTVQEYTINNPQYYWDEPSLSWIKIGVE